MPLVEQGERIFARDPDCPMCDSMDVDLVEEEDNSLLGLFICNEYDQVFKCRRCSYQWTESSG